MSLLTDASGHDDLVAVRSSARKGGPIEACLTAHFITNRTTSRPRKGAGPIEETGMALQGPWYISARAIKEYLALTARDPLDEDNFAAGEDELALVCSSAHHVRNQDNGLQLWRARSPERYRLLVSTARRNEGDLPQLVSVLAETSAGADERPQGQGRCAVCGKPCPKRNKHCRTHQTKHS